MASPFDTAKSAILGVPVDPNKKPSRTGIVQAFSEMQALVNGAAMGALIKNSLAALTATTSAPSAGAMAWVIGDTAPANNGIYENTGTISAAVWTRRADIPIGMITAINVGAGTANAIQVTTDLPVPIADGKCIVALPIVATNTSATVTISINGGAALTVSRNYGTALAVGDLVAGVFYLGIIAGGQFRLINPARDVVETLPPDGTVTAAKLAPGAVESKLGYTPAKTANLNRISIDAQDNGAIADNTTDNVAAFSAIATVNVGAIINLGNAADAYYTSAAAPESVQFINGTVRIPAIGSQPAKYVTFPREATWLPHEIENRPLVEVESRPGVHFWPAGIGEMGGGNTETMLYAYVMGDKHAISPGAPLILTARGDGSTPDRVRVLWHHKDYDPRGAVGAQYSETGFGVSFLKIDAAGNAAVTNPVVFVRTTDVCETPPVEEVMVAAQADAYFPHSTHVLPTGEVYVFGAKANRYIMVQKRSAAGVWSAPQQIVDFQATGFYASGQSIAEPSGIHVPGFGWRVVFRDDDGSQAQTFAVVANDDFSTVGPVVLSNIINERNPPAQIYFGGNIIDLVFSRTSTAVTYRRDEIQWYACDAASVFAANGAHTKSRAFGILASLRQFGLGYLEIKRLPSGRWVGLCADGETQNGSSNPSASRLFIMGGERIVLPSVNSTIQPKPRIHAPNLGWHDAPRGVAWTGVSAPVCTFARWRHQSNVGADISRIELRGSAHAALARMLPHKPQYAKRIVRAIGASGTYASTRIEGKEACMSWSGQPISLGRWFAGTFPNVADGHRFEISVYAGTGGSGAPADVTFQCPAMTSNANSLVLFEGKLTIPDLSAVVWGPNARIEIRYCFNAAGVVDGYDFGCWFNEGWHLIMPGPADIPAQLLENRHYVEAIGFEATSAIASVNRASSDDAGYGWVSFQHKFRRPASGKVTLLGMTPGDILIDATAGQTLSNLTLVRSSESSVLLAVYRIGGFTTMNQRFISTTVAGFILVDAENDL